MEYATREQAQNAVNTLSNQNLMGRLVYVREVRARIVHLAPAFTKNLKQDREAEPRFIGATAGRGGFGGGGGGGGPGSYGGGGGGGGYGGAGNVGMGGGNRQIYVANVCSLPRLLLIHNVSPDVNHLCSFLIPLAGKT